MMKIKETLKDCWEFILCLPWLLIMWTFCLIDPIVEAYYKLRKIPYKRTHEGFVTRKK